MEERDREGRRERGTEARPAGTRHWVLGTGEPWGRLDTLAAPVEALQAAVLRRQASYYSSPRASGVDQTSLNQGRADPLFLAEMPVDLRAFSGKGSVPAPARADGRSTWQMELRPETGLSR